MTPTSTLKVLFPLIQPHLHHCILIHCSYHLSIPRYLSAHQMRHPHHHNNLNVHFLPRLIKGMDGCFLTAYGSQPTSSNTSILRFLVSHNDISISRKSCLVTIRQLSNDHPWECWNSQLELGKRRWNLATSSGLSSLPGIFLAAEELWK